MKLVVIVLSLSVYISILVEAETSVYKLDTVFLTKILHRYRNLDDKLLACAYFNRDIIDKIQNRITNEQYTKEELINKLDTALLNRLSIILRSRNKNSNIAVYIKNCIDLVSNQRSIINNSSITLPTTTTTQISIEDDKNVEEDSRGPTVGFATDKNLNELYEQIKVLEDLLKEQKKELENLSQFQEEAQDCQSNLNKCKSSEYNLSNLSDEPNSCESNLNNLKTTLSIVVQQLMDIKLIRAKESKDYEELEARELSLNRELSKCETERHAAQKRETTSFNRLLAAGIKL